MAWIDDFNEAKGKNSYAHPAIQKGKSLVTEKLTQGKSAGNTKSIHDFIGMTDASFARPTLFEVMIHPKGTSNENLKRRMNLNCHTASIPGLSIATTDGQADGGYRGLAYKKIYGAFSATFYLHEDMKELKIFQDWMKLMIRPEDNHVGFYDDYISTIIIKKLDRQQNSVLLTTLYDAYPKSVSSLELGYGSTDAVMSVSVEFNYRHYTQTFGGKQEVTGRGNFTETSADDIESPLEAVNPLLKVGEGIKSGGSGLLDFRGAR